MALMMKETKSIVKGNTKRGSFLFFFVLQQSLVTSDC